jgi:hypothetical protein
MVSSHPPPPKVISQVTLMAAEFFDAILITLHHLV